MEIYLPGNQQSSHFFTEILQYFFYSSKGAHCFKSCFYNEYKVDNVVNIDIEGF